MPSSCGVVCPMRGMPVVVWVARKKWQQLEKRWTHQYVPSVDWDKFSRISQPAMISTTTITSLPTLSWSLINGDGHLPPLNIELLFLKLYSTGQSWMTNETIPNRTFKPERFLKNGKLDSSIRDPMDIAFGFGRRWGLFILSASPMSLSSPFW